MSTIASPRPYSPRPSLTLSTSSRRTSTDTITTARSPSVTRPATSTGMRRNRVALREFYGLKSGDETGSAKEDGKGGNGKTGDRDAGSEEKSAFGEVDREGFEAEGYVREVLGREGLEGVMRIEAGILSEIRGLDGERKALVYDNYSKLIAATDTIKKMRSNMDPLTPTMSTLTPAISHIAETASTLSESLKKLAPPAPSDAVLAQRKREEQKEAVKWVLYAPSRLRSLREQGQIESARKDWEQVKARLDKWRTVKGADEVRKQCEEVMGAEAGS